MPAVRALPATVPRIAFVLQDRLMNVERAFKLAGVLRQRQPTLQAVHLHTVTATMTAGAQGLAALLRGAGVDYVIVVETADVWQH